jgi:hypothetical protein
MAELVEQCEDPRFYDVLFAYYDDWRPRVE